jgi:hypothetical protein
MFEIRSYRRAVQNVRATQPRRWPLGVLFCVACLAAGEAKAVIYNARADFSPTYNPAGPWSYGYSFSLDGSMTLYPDHLVNEDGFYTWRDQRNWIKIPHVTLFDRPLTWGFAVESDELGLHPGRYGEISIIRWTAPIDGTCIVSADFRNCHGGDTEVFIYNNSVKLSDWVLRNMGDTSPLYNAALSVRAGDRFDFAVKAIEEYGNSCTTVVAATIDFSPVTGPSDVPEPSMLLVWIGLGGLGLVGWAWRQRRPAAITGMFLAVCLCGVAGANAAPVQWAVSAGGNGHWYEAISAERPVSVNGSQVVDGSLVVAYTGGVTWTAARDAATAKGGWIADIQSAAENDFVFSLVTSALWYPELGYGVGIGPWLGGFQPAGSPEPAGNWQWISGGLFTDANGLPTQYTNWYPFQPRNHYQIETTSPTEDALHFYDHSPYWQDYPSWTVTNGYIVEYASSPSDVPEPSTLLVWIGLCGLGLSGWGWRRGRTRA